MLKSSRICSLDDPANGDDGQTAAPGPDGCLLGDSRCGTKKDCMITYTDVGGIDFNRVIFASYESTLKRSG